MFDWIKSSWSTLQQALTKTRKGLQKTLLNLFSKPIDESVLEEVEETLFQADLGSSIIQDLMKKLRSYLKEHREASSKELLHVLEEGLLEETLPSSFPHETQNGPTVIVIVGANGNGKTTFIAKLAHAIMKKGKSPLLCAADTFRAGAQEQLQVWADRLQVDMVKAHYQADPAAVAYDAIQAGLHRKKDYVLIDTAGRLENKVHLLKELEKVKKSCQKAYPGAPHEVLLVLDAQIGQNSLEQAKAFHATTFVTGLVLTKLDGSAKGGSVIAIQKALKIPVKFLCFGEKIEDLSPFEPKAFIHSMLFDEES